MIAAAAVGVWWGCALTFPCSSDEQCTRGGATGVCQAAGYCSFPDDGCESGQRYGDLAPGDLAGTCVGGGGGGSTTDGGVSETVTATDTDATLSATSNGSSGILEGSTTDSGGSDDESSSGTTGEPLCCYAGCDGTCEGVCQEEQIGGPAVDDEAIGVAVVGDWVVWSTGFGRSLEISNVVEGTDEQLASVESNSFVTKIAADQSHVYFVDYGGSTVKRASVPDGGIDLVTQVDMGMAQFGGIVVGPDHVYFAMRGSGGIWRAAKDLSDQDEAEMVAQVGQPYDVALDSTHIYWTDTDDAEVRRMAFSDIGGPDPFGTTVYNGPALSTVIVDDDYAYIGDGGTVVRVNKDGENEGITTIASGQGFVWDIAVDSTHVYWSASGNDLVARALKDGSDKPEVLANTQTPWGLDLGCDSVFWAENGTQTLHRVLK